MLLSDRLNVYVQTILFENLELSFFYPSFIEKTFLDINKCYRDNCYL